eukprot:jgi/Hompol1/1696/HPOL_005684-RA
MKDSAEVLRNDADWFFVCVSHLSDVSFCRPEKVDASPQSSATATTTSQKTDLKTDPKTDPKTASKPASKPASAVETEPQQLQTQAAATASLPAQPKRYILSPNIYFLRENGIKKRAQAKSAKTLDAQLPSVPRRSGM